MNETERDVLIAKIDAKVDHLSQMITDKLDLVLVKVDHVQREGAQRIQFLRDELDRRIIGHDKHHEGHVDRVLTDHENRLSQTEKQWAKMVGVGIGGGLIGTGLGALLERVLT